MEKPCRGRWGLSWGGGGGLGVLSKPTLPSPHFLSPHEPHCFLGRAPMRTEAWSHYQTHNTILMIITGFLRPRAAHTPAEVGAAPVLGGGRGEAAAPLHPCPHPLTPPHPTRPSLPASG